MKHEEATETGADWNVPDVGTLLPWKLGTLGLPWQT